MKFTTIENEKVIIDFQKHFEKKTTKIIVEMCILIAIMGILFLFMQMYTSGIVIIAIDIFFSIFYPLTYKKISKKLNESNSLMKYDKKIEMEFENNKLSYKTFKDEEMINFSVVEYKDIYKVEETSVYFFIYLGMQMAVCVRKEDLKEEEIDELRAILQSNCSKYSKLDRRKV